ncbi:spore coat protein CotJB [Candidatus Soleaferrea massiliensis]|uniref:spore coat protein CotJB n=1 Tax=Candidatus Soleaferrea massiliensis TaxID=1470354 RepID=UPI00058C81D2|nr:spore coat protein CotJB [Candidatus Soleaferrea massiliensis]
MDNNNSREVLLKRVQTSTFALVEANLFLDTHPRDRAALEYFQRHHDLLQQATKEFTEKFGPLTPADYDGSPSWDWVSDPWPWENKEEA